MSPVPQLVCAKCGTPGTGLVCAACGGALVKICPNCEFKNSAQKNYCDQCGTEINLVQRSSTESDGPPQTITRRPGQAIEQPKAPSEGMSLPQAGRSRPAFEEDAEREESEAPAAAAPPPKAAPEKKKAVPISRPYLPSGVVYLVKSVLAILSMVVMGGAAMLVILNWRHELRPEVLVPKLARQYLDSLSRNDYATAYNMLSKGAKDNVTMDEFRLLRDTTPWTWSNLAIAKTEPDAVILQYDLQVEGRPSMRDTLVFVQEDGKWVRPYNWAVLRKAEEAFDRADPDLALLRAREAVRLDPRDPMARGYLCEAIYYRKLADQIENECKTAIELAARYPSKLSLKSLYHLHAILGDTYKNALRRFDAAAGEYTTMLAFPGISPEDQCDLLLARSDANFAMGKNDEALRDAITAEGVCTKPEDLKYIKHRKAEAQPPR